MTASGKKRVIDADGRVCNLGVWDGLRPARAAGRTVSSRGGSFSAKPLRLTAGEMDSSRSGSVSNEDLDLGFDRAWPELRVPVREVLPAAGSDLMGGRSAMVDLKAGTALMAAEDVSVGHGSAAAVLIAAGACRVGSANAADTLSVAGACRVGSPNVADVLTRLVPMSGSGDDGVNSNADDMVCLGGNDNENVATNSMSYADMLRNRPRSDSWADDVEEDVFTDADALFVPGRCGLNLKFSMRVLDALDRNWRYAVIVKLMGKPSAKNLFEFVLRGLRRKWLSKGCWKLIDLPRDYFVVNFELEE